MKKRSTVGTRKTLLFHNDAISRKTKVTVSYLEEQTVHVLTHTPYTPDSATSDFSRY